MSGGKFWALFEFCHVFDGFLCTAIFSDEQEAKAAKEKSESIAHSLQCLDAVTLIKLIEEQGKFRFASDLGKLCPGIDLEIRQELKKLRLDFARHA